MLRILFSKPSLPNKRQQLLASLARLLADEEDVRHGGSSAQILSHVRQVKFSGLVNEKFEALTPKRRVILGVYVVGNNAGGLYDSSYPTIEGLSNAFAWNSGRIAGENAAEAVK